MSEDKELDLQITILSSRDGVKIELRDIASGLRFLDLKISPEELFRGLFR